MKIKEIPGKSDNERGVRTPVSPHIAAYARIAIYTRVAAYARVSSDKDDAFHSLEAQTEYYKDYVAARSDWRLVDVYSDNGISGTTVNRPEFQRMLQDCRDGKIDLIVTKSVTRFARNTVILLETVRELKRLGVDVYFEKEDMHSMSVDGEFLLTLLAMYAEEEARSVSENQKWRIRKRFENGEPWVGKMLGYRLKDGQLEVVPDEAEIVRQIFSDYLSGMGLSSIAKKLKLQGVAPDSGNTWSVYSIHVILNNEKYTGNLVLQKTYREDFRTKKLLQNHGEVRKYYVEDSHEAIISNETFMQVQEEMARRAAKYRNRSADISNETKHLFCGLIQCGHCGRYYRYCRTNAGKYDKSVWACSNYQYFGKGVCPAQKIPEDILIAKTKEVLGVSELDRQCLLARIKKILVPENYHLRYILRDGTVTETEWQHRSRRESWTDEMREAARQRALAQRGKESK